MGKRVLPSRHRSRLFRNRFVFNVLQFAKKISWFAAGNRQ